MQVTEAIRILRTPVQAYGWCALYGDDGTYLKIVKADIIHFLLSIDTDSDISAALRADGIYFN